MPGSAMNDLKLTISGTGAIKIGSPTPLFESIKPPTQKRATCIDCTEPMIKKVHTTVVVLRSQRISTHFRASFCGVDCQENWWASGGSHWEHHGLNDPHGMYDVHTFETEMQMRAANAIGHFLQIYGFDESTVSEDRINEAKLRNLGFYHPKDLLEHHPYIDKTAIFHETDKAIEMGVFDVPAGSGYFSVGVPNATPDRRLVERWLHPEPWSLNAWFADPMSKESHRAFRAEFKAKVWGE